MRGDIDAILAQPVFERTYWGVVVKSLKTDETLYALNARKLMMPASNMKIVTLASAAATLGWNYTYETTVRAAGVVDGGVLAGDLVVTGSGDPSLTMTDGMADRLFADWASRLKAAGIRVIAGRIVGDDGAFDDEELGFGWSWDDLPDDYAAGIGALQINENAARVTVTPGLSVGAPASFDIDPTTAGLVVDNSVATAAEGGPTSIRLRRLPGSAHLAIRGTIAVGAQPVVEVVSADNPTLFFVKSLRNALIANGIDVRGEAVDVDDVANPPPTAGAPIITYRSPPLSQLATRLMKASQNQYAETLLKTLGRAAGTPSAAAGRASVQKTLEPWGIAAADLIQRDGSGLSRYDYVTADALATILAHVDRDQTLRGPFEASLPLAGRDGTLANRMKGTAAEGNARAKTGSMTNVRGLSGFVTSADGEPLVFSILANNFEMPASTINAAADAIVVRLATLQRGMTKK
ncbi:MAG TPA: D-alanyl-D-alanine carboxypeptidase/D-alanyl-D-alanine-endopeptidase [Vicinamibacterales bacterium]|nr:D-alanyl-D-alanine carboxypeptidase/D-alanyl-D-alanine-endopeptidase [Vicinamibacterales bacterium]